MVINPFFRVESFLGPKIKKNLNLFLSKCKSVTLLNSSTLTELIPFPNLPYDFRHALATGSDREKHHPISNSEDVDEQQDTESKVDVLKHDIEKLLLSAANRKSKTVSSKKKKRAQDGNAFQILGDGDEEDVSDNHVEDQGGSDHTSASVTEEANHPLEVTDSQGVGEKDGDRHASQVESASQGEKKLEESEANGIDSTAAHSMEKPSSLEEKESAHDAVPDIEEVDRDGNDVTETEARTSEDEPSSS